jgi:hypothetical protein
MPCGFKVDLDMAELRGVFLAPVLCLCHTRNLPHRILRRLAVHPRRGRSPGPPPGRRDRPTGTILPHVLFELDDWRKRISANEPCLITAHDEAPEWIFVTDASKHGGQVRPGMCPWDALHLHAHDWPPEFTRSEHSTSAEPWAVYNLICKTLKPGADTRAIFCSDNTPTLAALEKRESPSSHLNGVALALQRSFPQLRLTGHYVPGPANPVDGMSRGATNLKCHRLGQLACVDGISRVPLAHSNGSDTALTRQRRPLRCLAPQRCRCLHLGCQFLPLVWFWPG